MINGAHPNAALSATLEPALSGVEGVGILTSRIPEVDIKSQSTTLPGTSQILISSSCSQETASSAVFPELLNGIRYPRIEPDYISQYINLARVVGPKRIAMRMKRVSFMQPTLDAPILPAPESTSSRYPQPGRTANSRPRVLPPEIPKPPPLPETLPPPSHPAAFASTTESAPTPTDFATPPVDCTPQLYPASATPVTPLLPMLDRRPSPSLTHFNIHIPPCLPHISQPKILSL
jgi:hypothetical protein